MVCVIEKLQSGCGGGGAVEGDGTSFIFLKYSSFVRPMRDGADTGASNFISDLRRDTVRTSESSESCAGVGRGRDGTSAGVGKDGTAAVSSSPLVVKSHAASGGESSAE